MVESLARWVEDEYENKRQERVDTSEWPRHDLKVHTGAAAVPSLTMAIKAQSPFAIISKRPALSRRDPAYVSTCS